MKLKDIEIGMFVVCKEKHCNEPDLPNWVPLMDDTIGKQMTVIELDAWRNAIRCVPVGDKISWWYNPDWLSPWVEERKRLYYHGIDLTGLDSDIITRMAVSDNDFCSSKIFDTIARLHKCKQENPKTARLVDDLIKELVSILDLHVQEEKKAKCSLDKQIAELKEENEKLRKISKYLQKAQNSIDETYKKCINCKYTNVSGADYPCSYCHSSTHSLWEPKTPPYWVSALKKEYEDLK